MLAGQTHSPSPNSTIGKFVHIVDRMRDACRTDQPKRIDALNKKADELILELDALEDWSD